MQFYDTNLFYGTPVDVTQQTYKPARTIGEIDAALERAGVSGGLVRSLAADMSGVAVGNRLLAEDLRAARGELYGMYTIAPSCCDEIPAPKELPDVMKRDKMMAARFAPRIHNYLAKPGVLADYLSVFSDAKIPVMLDSGAGITVDDAWDYMEAFPNLTAILAPKMIWPCDRLYRPFIEHFPNLLLDLSFMITDQGIEKLVEKYGSERFLYGTRFPSMYMGGQLMMLRCAEISEKDKEMIAGGNFKRLAGWMK